MSKICPACERVYEDEHIFCAADGMALRYQGDTKDLTGSVIDDRYIITSLLGEGGMGRVYLGKHVHLPRQVAIKVLHERLMSDPAAVARFNREAASTSRIEHERVARVFDFGRMEGGATYLAMEFIPGRTLTDILEREGALEPSRVATLIWQVAEGLEAAHRLDIVHRDLKPDNVLVMKDKDGGECVKIVDFGIAKAIGEGNDGTLTAPGFVTGTPEYMSPEQMLGQTIDRRSDVFALGLLAYKALTTTLPFAPPSPERGFGGLLKDPPRRLTEAAPGKQWPASLQKVFDRVLAREPEQRFPTATAFAGAMRDVIGDWEASNASTRGLARGVATNDMRPDALTKVDHAQQRGRESGATRSAGGQRRAWLYPAVGGGALVAVAVAVMLARGGSDGDSNGAPAGGSTAAVPTVAGPSTGTPAVQGTGAATSTTVPAPDVAAGTAPQPLSGGAATPATASGNPPVTPPAPPPATPPTSVPVRPAIDPVPRRSDVTARIDTVRNALDALLLSDDSRATPDRANALVERVDRLLPDATTAADSARALLLKANLLRLAGERMRACGALDQARAVAASSADRNSERRYREDWRC